jgi:hypothetical protein
LEHVEDACGLRTGNELDDIQTLITALSQRDEECRRLHVQNLNLRAAINQIMSRYVEMYEYAGLGDPSESIAVYLARDATKGE